MVDNYFEITDEFGNNKILQVISLIEDPNSSNTYLIHTDNTIDEDGELNIFVSLVIRNNDEFILEDVEDYDDIDIITKQIDNFLFNQEV